jgi:hypothetical protein
MGVAADGFAALGATGAIAAGLVFVSDGGSGCGTTTVCSGAAAGVFAPE